MAQPLPPAQRSSPPVCRAFVLACQGAASLPLTLQQAPRGSWTGQEPISSPNPCSEPSGGAPVGQQTDYHQPRLLWQWWAFEGKVHFVNQPIVVGLPSTGSSSPGVSLGAVDTDVNCQGCPPPSTFFLGHPAVPAQEPLSQCSPLALARTKIATPSELPKLDWILHHEDWPWRLQLTWTAMADT